MNHGVDQVLLVQVFVRVLVYCVDEYLGWDRDYLHALVFDYTFSFVRRRSIAPGIQVAAYVHHVLLTELQIDFLWALVVE